MSIIDKVCGKIGLVDDEDDKLAQEEAALKLQEEKQRELEAQRAQQRAQQRANERNAENQHNNVVDFQSATSAREAANVKMKVIVIEPKTFDDAQQVANNLRDKKPVVINFEKTEAEDAKRIIDFISGTTYALNGEIKKVGHNVFLCAPSNVNVTYTEEERKVSSEMPWLKK